MLVPSSQTFGSLCLLLRISLCLASPTSINISRAALNQTVSEVAIRTFESAINNRIRELLVQYPSTSLRMVGISSFSGDVSLSSSNEATIELYDPPPSNNIIRTVSNTGTGPTVWNTPKIFPPVSAVTEDSLWSWDFRVAMRLVRAIASLRDQDYPGPWSLISLNRRTVPPFKGNLQYNFWDTFSQPPRYVQMDAQTGDIIRILSEPPADSRPDIFTNETATS